MSGKYKYQYKVSQSVPPCMFLVSPPVTYSTSWHYGTTYSACQYGNSYLLCTFLSHMFFKFLFKKQGTENNRLSNNTNFEIIIFLSFYFSYKKVSGHT